MADVTSGTNRAVRKRWPYPTDDHSGVGEAEQFVRLAREKYADDVRRLTQAVIGKQGRGFMQVALTPEEREARFRSLREQDDPAVWVEMLGAVKDDPKGRTRLLKQLRDQEAQWRGMQGGGS